MKLRVDDRTRVQQIKARADQATPGPWRVFRPRLEPNDHGATRCDGILTHTDVSIVETDSGYYPPCVPDAEFIAHARDDVPYLLGLIEILLRYLDDDHD